MPECNPIITPKVVMTPDVSPKPKPFHKTLLIFRTLKMPKSSIIVVLVLIGFVALEIYGRKLFFPKYIWSLKPISMRDVS